MAYRSKWKRSYPNLQDLVDEDVELKAEVPDPDLNVPSPGDAPVNPFEEPEALLEQSENSKHFLDPDCSSKVEQPALDLLHGQSNGLVEKGAFFLAIIALAILYVTSQWNAQGPAVQAASSRHTDAPLFVVAFIFSYAIVALSLVRSSWLRLDGDMAVAGGYIVRASSAVRLEHVAAAILALSALVLAWPGLPSVSELASTGMWKVYGCAFVFLYGAVAMWLVKFSWARATNANAPISA